MRKFLCALGLFSIFVLITPLAMPQSLVSGDISGTVSDPSGAVIKDAIVNLKSLDTGAAQTTATGASGMYRFSLLRPGRYSVKVTQQGFQGEERMVSVAVGQITTANFTLTVGKATEIVEVTGALPIINTESANVSSSYTQRDVSDLPNPGADLSNIAQLAPGITMNTSGGYGNFTANGMPATANLFTINGENYMDPFFNINNTGATNLSLGQNEIQEATVVTNPYSGQYGQQAGAQVNFITKSGTNAFHGSAKYLWNGRAMNANNWFNNNTDPKTSRPFVNANQWGADFGGPIQKDKTFFYVNTEGLRLLIPTVQDTYIPTTTFANAVLNNIANKQPNSLPLYQKLFKLWMGAPGAENAVPDPASCGNAAGVITGLSDSTACAAHFSATPGQATNEWIISGRLDHNFSENDKVFARFKRDDGLQATYTDPINANFNAFSQQPSYDGQLQWNHIFNGNTTNQFIMSGNWYTAVFQQNQPLANSTFPVGLYWLSTDFSLGANYAMFVNWNYPQGRNVTQYQFIDDLSYVRGNHTFKFGENFRRYDVTDFNNSRWNTPEVYMSNLLDFANGLANNVRQSFPDTSSVPIALYGLGVYAQDEWKATSKLKLTVALRLEHNSNPVCQTDCFNQFVAPWQSIQLGPDVPYNQNIKTGLHQAFRNTDAINLSPRFGFVWSPTDAKTVISGGIGIFYDALPQGMMEAAFQTMPGYVMQRVYTNAKQKQYAYWADPTAAGATAIAALSANAIKNGFADGATYNSLRAATGNVFRAPSFTNFAGTMATPQYQEWNLQVQREIGSDMSLIVNYTGIHGIHIPISNGTLNAWDAFGYGAGYPATVPDPSYATVTQWFTGAVSNSNNLNVTFQRRFSRGVSFQANYTWAHALDDVSNGGAFVYGNDSLLGQINPSSLKANNYGNAEYDIRHNFGANFMWEPPHKFANKIVNGFLGGWNFTGSLFARTGTPYTVLDGNAAGAFTNNANLYMPGQALGPGATFGAGRCSNPNDFCFNQADFVDSNLAAYPAFPNQRRNQYRGPGFFMANFSPTKNFNLTERMKLNVGANFYNVFNHPNFYLPNMYLEEGNDKVGQLWTTINPPASPFGSFLGADASPRLIQLQARITF